MRVTALAFDQPQDTGVGGPVPKLATASQGTGPNLLYTPAVAHRLIFSILEVASTGRSGDQLAQRTLDVNQSNGLVTESWAREMVATLRDQLLVVQISSYVDGGRVPVAILLEVFVPYIGYLTPADCAVCTHALSNFGRDRPSWEGLAQRADPASVAKKLAQYMCTEIEEVAA